MYPARGDADAASSSAGSSPCAALAPDLAKDRSLKTPRRPGIGESRAKSVFLIDDHPLVREWLAALINQTADLRVCGEASCARDALDAISRQCPDVAVVDLSLPDASGFDVIRSIKTQSPDTGIVVLSMHEERTYAERAIREGARAYVMKGDNTGAIISAVRKVVEGGLFLSPSMKIANAGNFLHGALSGARSPVERLSAREREVFRLLGHTHGTRKIAETLQISVKTVQSFCERIKEKLQLANASELLREAVRWVDSQQPHDEHGLSPRAVGAQYGSASGTDPASGTPRK
jgi:DNA-binding NarL/FixJ family response regulator